jgi:hypothetical protein
LGRLSDSPRRSSTAAGQTDANSGVSDQTRGVPKGDDVRSQSYPPIALPTLLPRPVTMPERHEEYYFDDGSVVLLVRLRPSDRPPQTSSSTVRSLGRGHPVSCPPVLLHERIPDLCGYVFVAHWRVERVNIDRGGRQDRFLANRYSGSDQDGDGKLPWFRVLWVRPCFSFLSLSLLHALNEKNNIYIYRMHDENAFTLESWIALLSFSTRFICDKIRARSIRELESIQSRVDPIERIVLAVRHNVPQWLNGAYQELCQRQDSLSEEEGEKLGLPTVIKLMRAREILLSGTDMRDPRFVSRGSRLTPGMSSTSTYLARMQLLDSEPVRPVSDFWGNSMGSSGVELRFDSQRVADVVREVFVLEVNAHPNSL